jgi:hypothetical protein
MKYIHTIFAFCFSIGISQGQSCEIDGIFHSTFEDVKLILNNNDCNSCHGGQNNLGSWNYNTYESFLTNGDCDKTMILQGDASNSYFFSKLGGGTDVCEESNENAHHITLEEISQIESWINFGAPEFCIPLYSDVRQMFDNQKCNSCHGDDPQAWRYDTYSNMFNNNLDNNCSEEQVIIKGNSSSSLLYDKINNDGYVSCGNEMNGEFGPMEYEDIAHIRDWINSGAFETSASLPVILTNFSVFDEKQEIRLNWSTEVEIGTEKFVIERSRTGHDFEQILELRSEGSPTLGYDYSIMDSSPNIGDNYYRLKILDFDGSYSYSNIRLARVKSGETIVTVYPNPAVSLERLTVKWLPRADEESTYLNIVDVNGQNLHRKIIFEGTNYVRLPRLLDGVYYIIVEDLFGGFILERVVIIN